MAIFVTFTLVNIEANKKNGDILSSSYFFGHTTRKFIVPNNRKMFNVLVNKIDISNVQIFSFYCRMKKNIIIRFLLDYPDDLIIKILNTITGFIRMNLSFVWSTNHHYNSNFINLFFFFNLISTNISSFLFFFLFQLFFHAWSNAK